MTHVTPEALAGYLDHDLPGEERSQVELHLATCAECRAELAEVRGLQRRHRRQWARFLVPAAAAAMLVAIAWPRQTREPSDIRAVAPVNAPLEIVAPLPSTEIAARPITFVWRSAGPGASYSVTLQAADGRTVWASTVADTVAVLPDSVALGSAQNFFWSVEALLPDGRAHSTGVKRVRTR
jgi:anti-sigma factor RsiW